MKRAKKYIDPNMDKSGRNESVRKALELSHNEIKNAIEIAYLEGIQSVTEDKENIETLDMVIGLLEEGKAREITIEIEKE